MRIAIIGFGLIGGSLARAIAGTAGWHVTAWSPSGRGPAAARDDGTVAAAAGTIDAAVEGAELVVMAAPPLACLALLDSLAGPLRARLLPGATLTDVASTKVRLGAAADAARLPFVGGHPMAGLETSGYRAAVPDLFVGRPWVVVPGRFAGPPDVERVEALVRAAGGLPVRMTAVAHDEAAAAISHLPLVLAAALVETVAGRAQDDADRPDRVAAARLAAGGWRDMTRLARGDPAMGAGIAATNAGPLAARLRDLRGILDEWLATLEAGGPGADPEAGAEARIATTLEGRFRAARDRLAEQ